LFAVIFEVQPKRERWDEYLDLAKSLKPELERIAGFIDNERFRSESREGWLLSLSTWADEKAVIRWRTHGGHHHVQEKGRFEVFADYHLRVGEFTADSAAGGGEALPQQRFDETASGRAKAVTITELTPSAGAGTPAVAAGELAARLALPATGTAGLVDRDVFTSIYTPGKLLLLASWATAEDAAAWGLASLAGGALRHRNVRIIRDYGMAERGEAPQYYPPVR
jgi:heme-degrading monooxygenase HmoA